MALADEIMSRYRSGEGGGGGAPVVEAETGGKSEAQIAAAKALIAAVKRGDPEAVCEAVQAIAAEY